MLAIDEREVSVGEAESSCFVEVRRVMTGMSTSLSCLLFATAIAMSLSDSLSMSVELGTMSDRRRVANVSGVAFPPLFDALSLRLAEAAETEFKVSCLLDEVHCAEIAGEGGIQLGPAAADLVARAMCCRALLLAESPVFLGCLNLFAGRE